MAASIAIFVVRSAIMRFGDRIAVAVHFTACLANANPDTEADTLDLEYRVTAGVSHCIHDPRHHIQLLVRKTLLRQSTGT